MTSQSAITAIPVSSAGAADYLLTPPVRHAWGTSTPPELPLIQWAAQFVNPNRLALDIGAHVGSWSIELAHHARTWHAFEPQRKTYNALCGSIALNGLDEQVFPHNYAVHSTTGEVQLACISGDGGGSHLAAVRHPTPPSRTETVRAIRLDDWFDHCADVGFIKLDVEGAELCALKGMTATLHASNYPPIIFECWNHEWFAYERGQLFEFLHSLGYATTPIAGWPEMTLAERGR